MENNIKVETYDKAYHLPDNDDYYFWIDWTVCKTNPTMAIADLNDSSVYRTNLKIVEELNIDLFNLTENDWLLIKLNIEAGR